eukprot:scaffold920_cov160-Pinguiococcus_pyrenoidosus.AAC.2
MSALTPSSQAFPNCHVHRMQKLVNRGSRRARLRVVQFSLVNPWVRMISTKEVRDQRETRSPEWAERHRDALVAERKAHHPSWRKRQLYLYGDF